MSDYIPNSTVIVPISTCNDTEEPNTSFASTPSTSFASTNSSISSSLSESSSSVIKHKKGKPLTKGQKTTIYNVYNDLVEKNPSKLVLEIVKMVHKICSVGKGSVFKILKEKKTYGDFVDRKICRKRKKTIYSELSSSQRDGIRKKVHEYFGRNENPTLEKILNSVQADEMLPNFSKKTLHKILKNLGFTYRNRKRNCIRTDSLELLEWRERFIAEIRQYRLENRKIYFTDETWLNVNHCVKKIWDDCTVTTARQAVCRGLSNGLKDPSGKGKRLIISHIGSDSGFLEGGLLCFESKTNHADYHDDMVGGVRGVVYTNSRIARREQCGGNG